MAVAVPSHTIRTIHGSFGSPSFSSVASHISQAQASSFASLPNITYPPSQSRADTLSILSNRTASASSSSQYRNASRPRSTSVIPIPPVVTRRAPPPPPQVIQITEIEDPFLDTPNQNEPVIISLPPPRRAGRTNYSRTLMPDARGTGSSSFYAPPPADRRAAKLVANVLLSRGCGRPMRRRPLGCGENKTYVKSCLSRMVEVDC